MACVQRSTRNMGLPLIISQPHSTNAPIRFSRFIFYQMLRLNVLSLLFIANLSCCVTATCYKPNGTAAADAYKPCRVDPSDRLSSVCCRDTDQCLENGLCLNPDTKQIWRESCTKKNWSEGGCQELCSTGVGLTLRSFESVLTVVLGRKRTYVRCCSDTLQWKRHELRMVLRRDQRLLQGGKQHRSIYNTVEVW